MRGLAFILAFAAGLAAGAAVQAAEPVRTIGPEDLKGILAEEQGNIVVVNLWATWCAPCLVEIPDLIKMEADLAGDKVTLIGIAVDDPTPGTPALVENFKLRYFPDFRTYARGGGELDYLISVIDPAWNEVVPTTYVLGRDGAVKTRIQGKKTLEEFKAEALAADG